MTTETLVTTGQTPTDPGTQQTAAPAAGSTSEVDTGVKAAAEQQAQPSPEGVEAPAAASEAKKTPEGDDTTKAADGKKPKDETAKEGAPEQYEDFQAPEGVQLDTELVGDLKTIAKELNLSQKDAQRVADLGPKLLQKLQSQQAEAIAQAREAWADSAKADKEFGGDALAENLAVAKQALEAFGTPELRSLLNESGIGNHPEVIRFMVRAGKAISSDTFVAGERSAGNAGKDPAKTLYPNQK